MSCPGSQIELSPNHPIFCQNASRPPKMGCPGPASATGGAGKAVGAPSRLCPASGGHPLPGEHSCGAPVELPRRPFPLAMGKPGLQAPLSLQCSPTRNGRFLPALFFILQNITWHGTKSLLHGVGVRCRLTLRAAEGIGDEHEADQPPLLDLRAALVHPARVPWPRAHLHAAVCDGHVEGFAPRLRLRTRTRCASEKVGAAPRAPRQDKYDISWLGLSTLPASSARKRVE